MATPIWLTDEDSEIAGFKRAKIPFTATQVNKSDCPSLVRVVTSTALGPAVLPIVRTVGGSTFSQGWITDPLGGPSLSNGDWQLHAWAQADSLLANAGIQVDISVFNGSPVVSAVSSEIGTSFADTALTTGAATPAQLVNGDRLVIRLSLTDAGGVMAAGHNVTLSYNGLYSRCEGDTWVSCPDDLTVIGAQQGAAIIGDIPEDDVLAIRTILRDFSSQIGLTSSPILDDQEIVRYIIQAVETYSIDRPYTTGYLYQGDGTTFDFPLPPKWIWQFSRVIAVEYPATSQQFPTTLESLDWEIRDQVLGPQPQRFIRFRAFVPDSGSAAFVQYSTRHTYSTEYSTITREDLDAVLWLAGSYCAAAISSRFAGSTDSTIEADVVNYRDSQRKWNDVAVYLKALYINRVVSPDSATPMGSMVEWRPTLSTGGASLWHSRRTRRTHY